MRSLRGDNGWPRSTLVDTRVENNTRRAAAAGGAADSYDVEVAGARTHGHVAEIENASTVGERIKPAQVPVLDPVQVDMRGIVVNREKQSVTQHGEADPSARLLPTDLAAYLEVRPNLEAAQVRVRPPMNSHERAR